MTTTKRDRKLFTFVGECRSPTAIRKGWTWEDGRLAAAPLFEALRAMGIDPSAQSFFNLYTDPPERAVDTLVVDVLREVVHVRVIVALGKRVSAELQRRGIPHVALVHPAARGKIRKRHRYITHVKKSLAPRAAA